MIDCFKLIKLIGFVLHRHRVSEAKANYSMFRCGECKGCKRSNCGKCRDCKDMKCFGGKGTRAQACVERKCLMMMGEKGSSQEKENDLKNLFTNSPDKEKVQNYIRKLSKKSPEKEKKAGKDLNKLLQTSKEKKNLKLI